MTACRVVAPKVAVLNSFSSMRRPSWASACCSPATCWLVMLRRSVRVTGASTVSSVGFSTLTGFGRLVATVSMRRTVTRSRSPVSGKAVLGLERDDRGSARGPECLLLQLGRVDRDVELRDRERGDPMPVASDRPASSTRAAPGAACSSRSTTSVDTGCRSRRRRLRRTGRARPWSSRRVPGSSPPPDRPARRRARAAAGSWRRESCCRRSSARPARRSCDPRRRVEVAVRRQSHPLLELPDRGGRRRAGTRCARSAGSTGRRSRRKASCKIEASAVRPASMVICGGVMSLLLLGSGGSGVSARTSTL